jgi:hypothetical protein
MLSTNIIILYITSTFNNLVGNFINSHNLKNQQKVFSYLMVKYFIFILYFVKQS